MNSDRAQSLADAERMISAGFMRDEAGDAGEFEDYTREDEYATLCLSYSPEVHDVWVTLRNTVGGYDPAAWRFSSVSEFLAGLPAIVTYIETHCGDEGDDHMNARVW